MKVITIDPTKCVGCRNCELACAFINSKTTCERKASMIRVNHYIDEHAVIPMTCLHCDDPWCMAVCPAGAIVRDPDTNAVVIDQDKCAGCKMCMLACPYGNIHFDEERHVSTKCTLCGGRPRCVGHCISGALNFEEVEEYAAKTRSKVDEQMSRRMRMKCRPTGVSDND